MSSKETSNGNKLLPTTTAMLFAGNVLGYLDRAAFAIAAPLIALELKLDPLQVGWLLSAFSLGYVAVSFIGGIATDRWGGGRVIAMSAVTWSVFCALSAAPLPFWGLVLVRIMFGVGEGPYTPAVNALVSAGAPARRYSSLLAFISAGQPLGGLLAGPVVGGLALAGGWRIAFVAIGCAGLAWAALWALQLRKLPRAPQAPPPASSRPRAPADPILAVLGRCLKSRAIMAVAIAYFGFGYVLYFMLGWFPTYLVNGLHVSVGDMSLLTTIPWAVGLIALILGGFVVNAMQRTTWGAVRGRKALLSGSLCASGVATALAAVASDPSIAVLLMSVAAFGIYLTGTCYLGLIRELVDIKSVGGVGGFAICVSSLGGVASPAMTGAIVSATGGYHAAFLAVAAISITSAGVVQLWVRENAHGSS